MKSYLYKYLLEAELNEGFFPSKSPIGKLTNNIISEIQKKNINVYSYHDSQNTKNKQIINTYYFTLEYIINYKEVSIPVRIKCRSSNHIKPDLNKAKDIERAIIANQTVHIDADFPNARDVSNIIDAINNLTLVAAQKAGKI